MPIRHHGATPSCWDGFGPHRNRGTDVGRHDRNARQARLAAHRRRACAGVLASFNPELGVLRLDGRECAYRSSPSIRSQASCWLSPLFAAERYLGGRRSRQYSADGPRADRGVLRTAWAAAALAGYLLGPTAEGALAAAVACLAVELLGVAHCASVDRRASSPAADRPRSSRSRTLRRPSCSGQLDRGDSFKSISPARSRRLLASTFAHLGTRWRCSPRSRCGRLRPSWPAWSLGGQAARDLWVPLAGVPPRLWLLGRRRRGDAPRVPAAVGWLDLGNRARVLTRRRPGLRSGVRETRVRGGASPARERGRTTRDDGRRGRRRRRAAAPDRDRRGQARVQAHVPAHRAHHGHEVVLANDRRGRQRGHRQGHPATSRSPSPDHHRESRLAGSRRAATVWWPRLSRPPTRSRPPFRGRKRCEPTTPRTTTSARLWVRMGLASGEVVLDSGGRPFIGAGLNLAARVMNLADGGQVFATDEVAASAATLKRRASHLRTVRAEEHRQARARSPNSCGPTISCRETHAPSRPRRRRDSEYISPEVHDGPEA